MTDHRRRCGVGALFLILMVVAVPVHSQNTRETPVELARRGHEELRRAAPVYDRDGLIAAADLFTRALTLNQQFAGAYMGLAEALLLLDQPERALAQITRARQLRAPATTTDILEAQIHIQLQDFQRAAALYDEVIRREPYNRDAQVARALLRGAEQMLADRALTRLAELERRFPEDRRLLSALVEFSVLRGDEPAARRYLAAALQYHGDIPSVQLVAARWALQNGDPERAEIHGRNTVRMAPTLEEGWLILARAALLQGNTSAARTHYEQLIVLDRDNYRAWYSRGVLSAAEGDRETAAVSFRESLRLQPAFEPPRLALEEMLMDLPLEAGERRDAALYYRAVGGALEERFLDRQAERAYRRGLLLYPFDTELRRRLAQMYLRRQQIARYLQELEVIRSLGDTSNDLEDRITAYSGALRDSPATRWDVDQFTAPRVRTEMSLHIRQSPETLEPGIATVVGQYLAHYLNMSQNAEVIARVDQDETATETLARARSTGAHRALLVDVTMGPTQIILDLQAVDPRTGEVLARRTIRRSGIDRVTRAVREAGDVVEQTVVPRGVVLQRRFDEAILSLGRVDGVEEGTQVQFLHRTTGAILGTGTVIAHDDLVAEVQVVADSPDRITAGVHVIPRVDPRDDDGNGGTPGADAIRRGDDDPPGRRVNDVLTYIFRLQ